MSAKPPEEVLIEVLPADRPAVRRGHARWYSDRGFWRKLGVIGGRASRKLLLTALTLFHCLRDAATPGWAKGIILGALGYLILPADAVPDLIPAVGLSDDWLAIAAALATVAAYVKDDHKARAREQVVRLLGHSRGGEPGNS